MARKDKYTKEILVGCLLTYYDKYNTVPTIRGMCGRNEFYPSAHIFIRYFGSFKNALIESNLYGLREDKNLFSRRSYTKEELLNKLQEVIDDIGRVPSEKHLRTIAGFPSRTLYVSEFGSYNNSVKLLGYDVNNEYVLKSDEQLLEDLIKLYEELGRTPTSRDIDSCLYTNRHLSYIRRFGTLYTAFDNAKIPYYKRTMFYSDEEIITMWKEYGDNLSRFLTLTELMEIDDKGIAHCINHRWGNYFNFIKHLGLESDYKEHGIKIYATRNGTRCFSYYELKITQWLEDNDIDYDKEVAYKNIIPNDTTNRRFDWAIKLNDKIYYIEMFGIEKNDAYDIKTKNKIEICKRNNLILIEIYPEDLKRPLNEVFSFLFEDNRKVI